MKIMIFNWRDIRHSQAGGSEYYLHNQARFWIDEGNSVSWICASIDGYPSEEKIDGINVYRTGGRLSLYPRARSKYRELEKPDVIIDVENGIPFFTPFYSNVPCILLIHHIHRAVWSVEMPFPASCVGRFLETVLMPAVYRKHRIVTVSQSSESEVKKLFPGNRIDIVHNGVSPICRAGEQKKSDKPEAVFVGRLKKYKRIDVILHAIRELGSNDLSLNIIGQGDDEERLKKICEQFKLPNVHFLGHIPDDRKVETIQRAWFAINPSMIEGWGVTNIEANACGTPVIGSNVPGVRDSVKDGKSGLLFEYGNHIDLAQKMKLLIDDSNLRKELSSSAIGWAEIFSWEKSAKKFLNILKDVAQTIKS